MQLEGENAAQVEVDVGLSEGHDEVDVHFEEDHKA